MESPQLPTYPSKVPKEQQDQLNKNLERLRQIHKIDSEWEYQDDKDDVSIYYRPDKETGYNLVRGEGIVPATPTQIKRKLKNVFNKQDLIYFDPDASFEIDPTRETGSFVESIEGKVFVAYSKSKAQWLVASRDVCLLSSWHEEADGTILLFGSSTIHEKCPEEKGIVRANVLMWAWVCVPVKNDPTKTKTAYIAHYDPKGSLPKMVVNNFLQLQAQKVANLRKVFEKRNGKGK